MLKAYLCRSLGNGVEPLLRTLLEKAQYHFLYVRFQRDLLRMIDPKLWAKDHLPNADAPELQPEAVSGPNFVQALQQAVQGKP